MFTLSIDNFIARYSQRDPGLNSSTSNGLRSLLGFMAQSPDLADPRWAAYMLATVKHECANQWQPIEESGKGAGQPYGQPVTVTAPDGTTYVNTYHGRGYVQLTWQSNYHSLGQALGLGDSLLLQPKLALEPQTAYAIMSFGMRNGTFTGKGLNNYINGPRCDYFNARRIINGLDQAALIRGYAESFETLLNASITTAERAAPATPLPSLTAGATGSGS
ncbi:MAG: hypothetical protein ACRD2O_02530 [Terriglobia bacterium]